MFYPKMIFVAGVVVVLSACTNPAVEAQKRYTAALQQAAAEKTAAMQECHAKYINGEFKTHVTEVQCSNPRIIAAYQQANYRDIDLIQLFTAKRLEVAEKVDNKTLTDAQAQLEMAQFNSQLTGEMQRRDMVNSRMAAQRAMAAASIMGAMRQSQPAPPTASLPIPYVPTQPAPVRTNCMQNGQFINCTSY